MTPRLPGPRDVPERVRIEAESRAGPCRFLTPLGRDAATFLFVGKRNRLVLERPEAPVQAEQVAAVVAEARALGVDTPETEALPGGWLVRPWIDGGLPTVRDPDLAIVLKGVSRTLGRLAQRAPASGVALTDVVKVWMERIEDEDPVSAEGIRSLGESVDTTPRLVHGDLGPQNFLLLEGDCTILIDWKGAGTAPMGFDAGWVLALNAIGRGLRMDPDRLFATLASHGASPESLRWGEALGLARLRWRSRRIPGAAAWREPVEELLRARLELPEHT